MGNIRLEGVEKWFEDQQVIKNIDLDVKDGEFIVLVGPSGCGKSTLLRLIAGLEEVDRGKIYHLDKDITASLPSERQIAMVFQSYALYPHMSVWQNLGFALKTAGEKKSFINARVEEAAEMLRLTDYLNRRPKHLSGGQRQRVAIGRAIVRQAKVFLFDEPLSNLDAALRVDMRIELARLHHQLNKTMIYVTHDQVEAMTMAQRIVVLDQGRIMQTGTPRELYQEPSSLFVAQFIGSPRMNILPVSISAGKFMISRHGSGKTGEKLANRATAKLGIRPEHITISDTPNDAHCQGVVEVIEFHGADTFSYINCENVGIVNVRTQGNVKHELKQKVFLTFDTDHLHFFDPDGPRLSS